MTRRRTSLELLPEAACAWLVDWLQSARAQQGERASKRHKRTLQRELGSVERLAADLHGRLTEGIAAPLLDEYLYRDSELRPEMLRQLKAAASTLRQQLAASRARQPVAKAADMYLHLLYRNGSRWPVMVGNDAFASAEIDQFASILTLAGEAGSPDTARKALTAARKAFDPHGTPDLLLEILRAGL